MKHEMNDARIASLSAHTERTKAEAERINLVNKILAVKLKREHLRLEIEQQTAKDVKPDYQEYHLGTIFEPADPPPSSELPKIGKAKIKVRIAMNIDLIAEYFSCAGQMRVAEWYLNKHTLHVFYHNLAAKRLKQHREKKSALEAEIMEKLLEK